MCRMFAILLHFYESLVRLASLRNIEKEQQEQQGNKSGSLLVVHHFFQPL